MAELVRGSGEYKGFSFLEIKCLSFVIFKEEAEVFGCQLLESRNSIAVMVEGFIAVALSFSDGRFGLKVSQKECLPFASSIRDKILEETGIFLKIEE